LQEPPSDDDEQNMSGRTQHSVRQSPSDEVQDESLSRKRYQQRIPLQQQTERDRQQQNTGQGVRVGQLPDAFKGLEDPPGDTVHKRHAQCDPSPEVVVWQGPGAHRHRQCHQRRGGRDNVNVSLQES